MKLNLKDVEHKCHWCGDPADFKCSSCMNYTCKDCLRGMQEDGCVHEVKQIITSQSWDEVSGISLSRSLLREHRLQDS